MNLMKIPPRLVFIALKAIRLSFAGKQKLLIVAIRHFSGTRTSAPRSAAVLSLNPVTAPRDDTLIVTYATGRRKWEIYQQQQKQKGQTTQHMQNYCSTRTDTERSKCTEVKVLEIKVYFNTWVIYMGFLFFARQGPHGLMDLQEENTF